MPEEMGFTGSNDETYPETYLEHCLCARIDHGVDGLFNSIDETHCRLFEGFNSILERKVVWVFKTRKKIIILTVRRQALHVNEKRTKRGISNANSIDRNMTMKY